MKNLSFILIFLSSILSGYGQLGPIVGDFSWTDPLCGGKSITFTDISTGGTATGWQWRVNGVGVGNSPICSYTFPQTTMPTVYIVRLIVSSGGYADHIDSTITIFPTPSVAISPNSISICEGDSVFLSAAGISNHGSLSYHWYDNYQLIDSGNTFTSPKLASNHDYVVKVTDSNRCAAYDTSFVSVNLIDTTVLNQSFCQGSSYTFFGSILIASGIYYHTLSSIATGCDSIIQLDLVERPPYLITEPDVSTCQGDSLLWQGNYYNTPGTYTANYMVAIASIKSLYLSTQLISLWLRLLYAKAIAYYGRGITWIRQVHILLVIVVYMVAIVLMRLLYLSTQLINL